MTLEQPTRLLILLGCITTLAVSGCGGGNADPSDQNFQFAQAVRSNVEAPADLDKLRFIDKDGKEIVIGDFRDGQPLVLVFTRGFANSICLYCTAQTSRWFQRYSELTEHQAKLAIVFPVSSTDDSIQADELRSRVLDEVDSVDNDLPFPILIDVELEMVNRLGISEQLSKPATYVLDSQGQVRFAYVGQSMADRPSIDSVIDQLEKLQALSQ